MGLTQAIYGCVDVCDSNIFFIQNIPYDCLHRSANNKGLTRNKIRADTSAPFDEFLPVSTYDFSFQSWYNRLVYSRICSVVFFFF
jgi:hypothetical protein